MASKQQKNGGLHTEKEVRNGVSPKIKAEQVQKEDSSVAPLSLLAVGVVIVIAVFRTTLVHQAQSLLAASGHFITTQWDSFYNYFEGDMAKMGLALYVFAVLEYYVLGSLFLFVDLTGKPSFISKYKIQRNSPKIPAEKLRRLIKLLLLNHLVFNIPSVVGLYHTMRWRGSGVAPSELPTFPRFLLEVLVFFVCEDIGFYYSHRLLHYPPLYKAFHKVHHEWPASIGLVTTYAHPVENLLSNSLPAIAGPLLMRSHLLTVVAWLVAAQTVSMFGHSGYHFPFCFISPESHDFHHLKFTSCYGNSPFFDWLHGTDVEFRKSKQFLRDKMFFSFTPINDLIPDDPKPKKQ